MPSSVAIGIDFGTTYSRAGVWRDDNVQIIPNHRGNRATPSCVSFKNPNHPPIIGDSARQIVTDTSHIAFNAKRLIGRKFADPEVQLDIKNYPQFEVVNKNGKPYTAPRSWAGEFAPEEAASMILNSLREAAEHHLGATISQAVVSVPAYFNYRQRQALRDAGRIIGLDIIRILPNPICAALAYGVTKTSPKARKVLVFDLGGGTCDASVITVQGGSFKVRDTIGDNHLGGEDFDTCLVNHFISEFKDKNNKNIRNDPLAVLRLRVACEQAKHDLSFATQTYIKIDALYGGVDFRISLTRARFVELCKDLFTRIEEKLRILRFKHSVKEVILVGGSTRMPRLVEIVSNIFGHGKLNADISRDEAVAYGAAIQAAILCGNASPKIENFRVSDIVPFSLGIEYATTDMFPFIQRSSVLPTRRSQVLSFTTNGPRQHFRVYESGPVDKGGRLLAEFEFASANQGSIQTQVIVEFDADYVLGVSVSGETDKGPVDVRMSGKCDHLSAGEFAHMVSRAVGFKVVTEGDNVHRHPRNRLLSYSSILQHRIANEELANGFRPADKTQLKAVADKTVSWVKGLHSLSEADCKKKQMEIENVIRSIGMQNSPFHDIPSPATSLRPSPRTSQSYCRTLLLQILNQRPQKQINKLPEDDIQLILDYLDIVSREVDTLKDEERRKARSLLCRVAKSAKLYPRCYVLTGIQTDQEAVAGGGFADVWKGKYEDQVLCLKVVRVFKKHENENILRTYVQELTLWAQLSHKNILQFLGVYLIGPTQRICLVSPWIEKGNLRDYLDNSPQLPRMPFISDIVDGLTYLHGEKIVHSDLKAQNILVSGDERALIADFGLSFVEATTKLTSLGGTTRFMAPELVLEEGKATKSCDIWSLACLCYNVLTNELPFYQYKETALYRAMGKKEIPLRPKGEESKGYEGLGDEMWDLLIKCWSYEPQMRPRCKEIQKTIKNIGFQDNRPKITAPSIGAASTFWKTMREHADNEVDYKCVEEILRRVVLELLVGVQGFD